jgi:hypothetical protein
MPGARSARFEGGATEEDDRVGGLPADLHLFLRRRLRSPLELQVLLFLRESADREWTAEALAPLLGVTESAAGRLLFDLMARRLARLARFAPPSYVYDPAAGPETRREVDRLAELYAERPADLLAALEARGPDSVQQFADAFRLREET